MCRFAQNVLCNSYNVLCQLCYLAFTSHRMLPQTQMQITDKQHSPKEASWTTSVQNNDCITYGRGLCLCSLLKGMAFAPLAANQVLLYVFENSLNIVHIVSWHAKREVGFNIGSGLSTPLKVMFVSRNFENNSSVCYLSVLFPNIHRNILEYNAVVVHFAVLTPRTLCLTWYSPRKVHFGRPQKLSANVGVLYRL